jgi:hypothetical protein
MKITEKFNDGTTNVIAINLVEGKEQTYKLFYPDVDNEPIAIRILESGWRGMYHVLFEHGDMEQTDYMWLDAAQIAEKFGIAIKRPTYTQLEIPFTL